ncbi:MAG: hypothetical protein IKF19_04475 [Bacilli bacterium]|nr:hypothetical protein [Bacilli bacterium]
MYFLAFGLDDIKADLFMLVEGMFRGLFYSLCSVVYKMIYYFYNVFTLLCNGQLLNSDELTNLFSRVGGLLAIIMFFRMAFTFIQSLIDPDSAFDAKKGVPGTIKKVIIVIIMFGISQYAFELSRDFQVLVIEKNVIPNLILPYRIKEPKDKAKKWSYGSVLAANLFTAFYNVNDNIKEEHIACNSRYISNLQKSIAYHLDFSYGRNLCIAEYGEIAEDGSKEFYIDFNFIFCILVGGVVLWFLLNYCIQVGMRIVQLTVLQVVAPVAFISYLSPKDENAFTSWWKLYLSTYIDVFIRIGIINFVCYLSVLIIQGWNSDTGEFWSSVSNPADPLTGFTRKVVGIIMILALFSFAKKAPQLLSKIFPTGESGLSFGTDKSSFKPLGVGAAAAVGGIAGGVTSAGARFAANKNKDFGEKLLGGAGGFFGGAARGLVGGGKGGFRSLKGNLNKQRELDNKYKDLIRRGGSVPGAMLSGVKDFFGTTPANATSIDIENQETMSGFKDSMNGALDNISFVKDAKEALANMKQGEGESIQSFIARRNNASAYYRSVRKAFGQAIDAKHGKLESGQSISVEYDTGEVDPITGKAKMATQTFTFNDPQNPNPDDVAAVSQYTSVVRKAAAYNEANNLGYNIVLDENGNVTSGSYKSVADAAGTANQIIAELNSAEYERQKAMDEYAGVGRKGK